MLKFKSFNILIALVIALIVYQIGVNVSRANKDSLENRIKNNLKPVREGQSVHVNVAMACPRTTITNDDPIVRQSIDSTDSEYNHCRECGMGVYFKRDNILECSYCNHKTSE